MVGEAVGWQLEAGHCRTGFSLGCCHQTHGLEWGCRVLEKQLCQLCMGVPQTLNLMHEAQWRAGAEM